MIFWYGLEPADNNWLEAILEIKNLPLTVKHFTVVKSTQKFFVINLALAFKKISNF